MWYFRFNRRVRRLPGVRLSIGTADLGIPVGVPALSIIAACMLSGCPAVMVNELDSGSHKEVTQQKVENLVVGMTTRSDVLSLLGKPDSRDDDDNWWKYESERASGAGLAVLIGGVGFIHSTANRVTIVFDSSGIVSSVDFHRYRCRVPFVQYGNKEDIEECTEVDRTGSPLTGVPPPSNAEPRQ
jgi:outer membrane protein assembly factor BamE (lipoprotein component of BamABCDE complex)